MNRKAQPPSSPLISLTIVCRVVGFDFHGGMESYAKEGGFSGATTGVTAGQGGLASGRQ
jgi:hypothetical protein